MYKEKRILAVITARGGSKGIKGKNIKELNGKPLIEYSIEACKECRYIDKLVLSTDDIAISNIAKKSGVDVPFMRPAELASDTATSLDVIKHAINFFDERNEKYDYIVIVQPTSPFRTNKHFNEAIEMIIENNNMESIVGVSEVEYSPYWMKKIEDGMVVPFSEINENTITRRQDLPKVYKMNGALFISKYEVFMEKNKVLGDKVLPYYMDEYESIDIDNMLDFNLAELIINSDRGE